MVKLVDRILMDWVRTGNEAEAKDLIQRNGAKVDVNAKDKLGMTPLHWAVTNRHASLLKLLIDSDAYVNAKDKLGETPLHRAAQMSEVRACEELLDAGANVNARDERGRTALHWAIHGGVAFTEVCKVLIENGADVNAQDRDGYIPVKYAARYGINFQHIFAMIEAERLPKVHDGSFVMPANKSVDI